MARDYKKEYRDFHGKPEQKKRRAMRNKARRAAMRAGKVSKGDGKDVHHKDNNPKNNSKSNVKVTSSKYNKTLGAGRSSGNTTRGKNRRGYKGSKKS